MIPPANPTGTGQGRLPACLFPDFQHARQKAPYARYSIFSIYRVAQILTSAPAQFAHRPALPFLRVLMLLHLRVVVVLPLPDRCVQVIQLVPMRVAQGAAGVQLVLQVADRGLVYLALLQQCPLFSLQLIDLRLIT